MNTNITAPLTRNDPIARTGKATGENTTSPQAQIARLEAELAEAKTREAEIKAKAAEELSRQRHETFVRDQEKERTQREHAVDHPTVVAATILGGRTWEVERLNAPTVSAVFRSMGAVNAFDPGSASTMVEAVSVSLPDWRVDRENPNNGSKIDCREWSVGWTGGQFATLTVPCADNRAADWDEILLRIRRIVREYVPESEVPDGDFTLCVTDGILKMTIWWD